jgi:hypothetical protein
VITRGGVDAVIAQGAVIRGATPHFDYVAGEAAHGIAAAAIAADVAVSFGVLTTDTIEQALERAGTKAGNKGFDAALAAIELATLYRALAPAPRPHPHSTATTAATTTTGTTATATATTTPGAATPGAPPARKRGRGMRGVRGVP